MNTLTATLLANSLLCFYAPVALASDLTALPAHTSAQPNIKVLSDQMDCEQEKKICIASGNASAEKLGSSKRELIKADKLIIHFSRANDASSLKAELLEAAGNVIIISGDIIAQGNKANYRPNLETAEIWDDVRVTSGLNQLEGSYGHINVKTQQYTIKRKGKKVRALIYNNRQ